jgi:hypothetical protein
MKLARYPSTNEWIEKMCYIGTIECHSPIKKNETSFGGKWVELDIIMLSKISQTQKDKYCMLIAHVESGFF